MADGTIDPESQLAATHPFGGVPGHSVLFALLRHLPEGLRQKDEVTSAAKLPAGHSFHGVSVRWIPFVLNAKS